VFADTTTVLENNEAGVYGDGVALYATKVKMYAGRYQDESGDSPAALAHSGYSSNTDAALNNAS